MTEKELSEVLEERVKLISTDLDRIIHERDTAVRDLDPHRAECSRLRDALAAVTSERDGAVQERDEALRNAAKAERRWADAVQARNELIGSETKLIRERDEAVRERDRLKRLTEQNAKKAATTGSGDIAKTLGELKASLVGAAKAIDRLGSQTPADVRKEEKELNQ